MKKLITLSILFLSVVVFGFINVNAQTPKPTPKGKKPANAKDLYTQYNENSSSNTGAAGAKVSILLKRGNQPEKLVSPNETFYSGDKIKLVLDINFKGYAAIINTGSSGKQNVLFPYIENGKMVDHSVSPNAAVKLPRGSAWINFDNQTGEEKVTIIFSKNPIAEMESYEEATTSGSDGRIASQSEADTILAELNSKSLSKARSKDLYTQNEGDATYGVVEGGLGNEPVAFTFYLKHR